MGRRSGKFYRKNENEVMEQLGFKPTKGSGSGWIEKEDGENEKCICQLKSTDANSIRIDKLDIEKLLYHSNVSHKLPVFAIQFLKDNQVFVLIRPEDLVDVAKYIETGTVVGRSTMEVEVEVEPKKPIRTIRSSGKAREQFARENEKKFQKGIRSAK